MPKDARTSFAWRLLPSFTDVIFIYIFLLLFFGYGHTTLFTDGDTGWHIRTGEYILEHGSIPRFDLFSYTMGDKPWFAWEWLSDVIFALLHRSFGLNGISLFSALTIAFTYTLLFKFILSRGANIFVSVLMVGLATYASTVHWLARPHILSWLLCLIYYWILDEFQRTRTKYILLLPILMLLWVNLHGGFLIGIILIVIYAIGNLLTFLVSFDALRKKEALGRFFWLMLCGLITLLVTLLNPYGYRLHMHIYDYLRSSYIISSIEEYASPDFHHRNIEYFEMVLMLALMSALLWFEDVTFINLGLVFFWGHFALQSARHIPIFGIVAAPIIAYNLTRVFSFLEQQKDLNARFRSFIRGFTNYSANIMQFERQLSRHILPLLVVAIFSGIVCFSYGKMAGISVVKAEFDPARFPSAAVDFISAHESRFHGNLLNPDFWGGYLIYRLYPKIKVFIDGRSDAYPEKLLRQYAKVLALKPGWKAVLHENNISWIIVPVVLPVSMALKESPEWKIAYEDSLAILFMRKEASTER